VTVVASIDWTNIAVAFIAGAPGIIAALGIRVVHGKIKTPSGTSIGEQVENALHTSLANNYRLRSIGDKVHAPVSAAAHAESEQVSQLPESPDPGK
jgi:hypothetical protein